MSTSDLVASVERLQSDLGQLRERLNHAHAPLSMGDRDQASQTIATVAACLGNLKKTLKRGEEPHG